MNGEPPHASESCPPPQEQISLLIAAEVSHRYLCCSGPCYSSSESLWCHSDLSQSPCQEVWSSVPASVCAPSSPCPLLYHQSDTTEQLNQTLIGVFVDHSITGTWLDGRRVGVWGEDGLRLDFLMTGGCCRPDVGGWRYTTDSNHMDGESLVCCGGLPGNCPADWMPAKLNHFA